MASRSRKPSPKTSGPKTSSPKTSSPKASGPARPGGLAVLIGTTKGAFLLDGVA